MPLFYKLLPGPTATAAPVAQFALSVAAWLVLAAAVAACIETRWLRIAGFVVVLGFSLSSVILQWDGALLTESLTFSEVALLIAALLVTLRRRGLRAPVLVVLAAVACAATRDASGYYAALLLLPTAFVLWLHRRRRPAVLLGTAAIAIAAMVFVTSGVERWQILMRDVVAIRVVPSPARSTYFQEHGMPSTPGLPRLLFTVRDPPSPFPGNPQLRPFHAWLLASGSSTYRRYLITHPGYSLLDPLRNLGLMVGPTKAAAGYVVAPDDSLVDGMPFYRQPGYRPALPRVVESVFYAGHGWIALCWMISGLMVLAAGVLLEVARRFWIVPGLLIGAIVPFAVIIWDATPLEVARHSLFVAVLGRLGLWLAVLFAGDAYLRARAARSSS